MPSLISDVALAIGNDFYYRANNQLIAEKPHGFLIEERDMVNVTEPLLQKGWQKNDCHIGIGGFANLDIIATGVPYSILGDINSSQELYWKKIKSLIARNPNRVELVKQMKANELAYDCRVNHKYRFSWEADMELNRQEGWLSSDNNYETVRNAVLEDRVQFVSFDITDIDKAKMLRNYLDRKGLRAGSMYLSNAPLAVIAMPEGFYGQSNPNHSTDKMCRTAQILSIPETRIIACGLDYNGQSYDPEIYSPSAFREKILKIVSRQKSNDSPARVL